MTGQAPARAIGRFVFGAFLGLYLFTASREPSGGFAPAALGALGCLVAFRLYRRVGAGDRAASLVTVVLGTATMIWPYARRDPTAMLEAVSFTGFVDALVAAAAAPGRLRALAVGTWGGVLVFQDPVFAVALLGAAVYLRRDLLVAALALLPFIILAALGLGGDVPDLARYREHLFDGLFGLALSTGKGAPVFSPPLLLGLLLLPWAARRHRAVVLALAVTVVPVLIVHGMDLFWSGGQTWGAPGVLFLVPAGLVPLALAVEEGDWRWVHRFGAGAVVAAGLVVQLAGIAVAPGHFLAVSHDVGAAWLGRPDLRGADPLPCIDCFEETHRVDWLPPFQPIVGNLWLARHVIAGDDYGQAQADAPWRRYVDLPFDASAAYGRARVDWWALDAHGVGGGALVAGEAALLAAGAWLWRRRLPS